MARVFLGLIAVLFAAIGLLPVLSMLFKTLVVDGHFSTAAYQGLLSSAHQWTLMGHSLALASLVTALTIAVGVPLGIWLRAMLTATLRNHFLKAPVRVLCSNSPR